MKAILNPAVWCVDRHRRAHACSPGLTSAGGSLPEAPGLPAERAVAVFAQGKELPCAIGLLKMSTEEIKKVNKGHGIETVAYLNDDLWKLQTPGARGLA